MTKKLLVLNGFAVLGVAIFHAGAYGFLALFNWTHAYRDVVTPNYDMLGSPSYYYLLVARMLVAYSIPAFLTVSGFFAAFASDKSGKMPWQAVWSRVQKFIWPFIIWTVLFIVMRQMSPSEITFGFLMRTYYYIPLIVQLYILSPIIGPFVKKHWKMALVITAVIQLTIQSFGYLLLFGFESDALKLANDLTPRFIFTARIFYFTLGMALGYHRKMFTNWFKKVKYGLLAALVLFAILSVVEYLLVDNLIGERWLGANFIGVFRTLYATTFSLTFLAFDKVKWPYEKQLNQLGTLSLGVYLANTPVIYVISSLMFHFVPWTLGVQLIYQPVLILTGLFIPVLLMNLLSKSPVRRYYQVVFG